MHGGNGALTDGCTGCNVAHMNNTDKREPIYKALNETARIRVEQAIREGRACPNCGSENHSFCNR